jgi:hypothetical protein
MFVRSLTFAVISCNLSDPIIDINGTYAILAETRTYQVQTQHTSMDGKLTNLPPKIFGVCLCAAGADRGRSIPATYQPNRQDNERRL